MSWLLKTSKFLRSSLILLELTVREAKSISRLR